MKKLLALILCVLMLPVLALADAPAVDLSAMTDQELSDLAADIAAEQVARKQASTGYIVSGELGVYSVGLKAITFGESKSGKIVTLTFDFSHTDADSHSFLMSIMPKVFQDGIELSQDYFTIDAEGQKEIKSGATIEASKSFILSSKSPLEIEIDELISFDDIKLTATVPVE